jgi:hypothetical protein
MSKSPSRARVPGERAHDRAKELTSEFRRRWGWQLLGIGAAFSLLIVVLALLEPSDFARGLLLGAGLATIGCGLCFVVLLHHGSYTWRRGADAEELTAELLMRRLPSWTVVHSLLLNSADIDHIAVGPGGVIAVETKWTSSEWENQHGRRSKYVAALAQARRSAERLERFLASKGSAVDVQAMLVVWGRGAPGFATGMRCVDDVLVVDGPANPELRSHFPDLPGFDPSPVVVALSAQR